MGWKVDEKYAELVNRIDIIIGAHTHDILYRPALVYNQQSKRDVIIVQCGSHSKLLGQLDIKVDRGPGNDLRTDFISCTFLRYYTRP